jgi:hypothetical protein
MDALSEANAYCSSRFIDRVVAERKWYSDISRAPTGRWIHSTVYNPDPMTLSPLWIVISRLRVFLPDLLDNYVYPADSIQFQAGPSEPCYSYQYAAIGRREFW